MVAQAILSPIHCSRLGYCHYHSQTESVTLVLTCQVDQTGLLECMSLDSIVSLQDSIPNNCSKITPNIGLARNIARRESCHYQSQISRDWQRQLSLLVMFLHRPKCVNGSEVLWGHESLQFTHPTCVLCPH